MPSHRSTPEVGGDTDLLGPGGLGADEAIRRADGATRWSRGEAGRSGLANKLVEAAIDYTITQAPGQAGSDPDDWSEEMSLKTLHPSQRFMYEFGCFAAFWSNFELLLEIAIGSLMGRSPKENCRLVNRLTAGRKRQLLKELLESRGHTEALRLLEKTFAVAERNDWLHGHILNPNHDFSRLTRLRIQFDADGGMLVANEVISFEISPFAEFYAAFDEFQASIGLPVEDCNQYILALERP